MSKETAANDEETMNQQKSRTILIHSTSFIIIIIAKLILKMQIELITTAYSREKSYDW